MKIHILIIAKASCIYCVCNDGISFRGMKIHIPIITKASCIYCVFLTYYFLALCVHVKIESLVKIRAM